MIHNYTITFAAHSILLEHIAILAGAGKTAYGVDAILVTANVNFCTFIDICRFKQRRINKFVMVVPVSTVDTEQKVGFQSVTIKLSAARI